VISYADKALRLNNLLCGFVLSYKCHWYMVVAERMNINFLSFVRTCIHVFKAVEATFCVIELQWALFRLTSLALSDRSSCRAAL
jgi:hypothetical protein